MICDLCCEENESVKKVDFSLKQDGEVVEEWSNNLCERCLKYGLRSRIYKGE